MFAPYQAMTGGVLPPGSAELAALPGKYLNEGLAALGEGAGKAMDEQKRRSRQTDALRTLLETSGIGTKEELNSKSLDELMGIQQGVTMKQTMQHALATIRSIEAKTQAVERQNQIADNTRRAAAEYMTTTKTQMVNVPGIGLMAVPGAPFDLNDMSMHIAKNGGDMGLMLNLLQAGRKDISTAIMQQMLGGGAPAAPASAPNQAWRPPMMLPDRKSTRLNSSHVSESRMPSSA